MGVLEGKPAERSKLVALVGVCLEKKAIKLKEVARALVQLLPEVDELQMDIPKVGDFVAEFCAQYLANGGEMADILEGFDPLKESNKALKLMLILLRILKENKSEQAARECFSSSGIELKSLLPEDVSVEEHDQLVADCIKSQKAEWLMPLLGCQEYLSTAYSAGTGSEEMIGWIRQNVAEDLVNGPKFARIMMRTILNHANPGKATCSLEKYSAVMQAFFCTERAATQPELKKMVALQMACLFEVQLYCYERDFKDKLMVNLFSALYQDDIIEEDAFMAWAEDQTDTTPEKGKAIMAAGQFLTWLEEQEQEEESDEDDE